MSAKKQTPPAGENAESTTKVVELDLTKDGGDAAGALLALLLASRAQRQRHSGLGGHFVDFSEEAGAKLDEAGYKDGTEDVCELNNVMWFFSPTLRETLARTVHMATKHRQMQAAHAVKALTPFLRWTIDYAKSIETIIGEPLEFHDDDDPQFFERMTQELALIDEMVQAVIEGREVPDEPEPRAEEDSES